MNLKYKKLVSNTLIFAIGNFITKFIYFFLMPIYTLTLTTKEFGLSDLLNNSLQLILPILTLSITEAVFRFSLDKDIYHQALLSNAIRILLISYLLVFSIIVIAYTYTYQSYWIYFGLLYVVESLKTLLAQFTRGIGKVKAYAINGIIGAICLLIATWVFLKVLNYGTNGYLLSFITAEIASIIFLLWIINIKNYINLAIFDKVLIRKMLYYSLPLIPNTLSWWLTNISSRYVIAGFCGIGIAGLFSAASKLPTLINVFASVFQLSWQYSSVQEYQESKESSFYSTVFQYYSIIILVCGSIIIWTTPYISKFILKGNFYEAWVYTPLLIFSAIVGCYSMFFGTFYSTVKNSKGAMYSTLYGSSANLILCFALIPLIGVMGALIANVVSYAVITFIRYQDALKYITLRVNNFKLISSLIIILIESVIITSHNLFPYSIYLIFPCLVVGLHCNEFISMIKYIKTTIVKRNDSK